MGAETMPSEHESSNASENGLGRCAILDAAEITVIILSFNEEIHIGRCIERIKPLAHRIVVVDSFSTDRTVAIARDLGAEVFQRQWKNHSDQLQWAIDNVSVSTRWVLRLDCDEYLEPSLVAAIPGRIANAPLHVTGFDFKLKVIFRRRFIRWGGYYKTILTRLWRTGSGRVEQRWMDERVVLAHGTTEWIREGDLVDENLNDIHWWTEKHNRYATGQMIDFINLEHSLFPVDTGATAGANRQTRWRRFRRNIVFARAPLYLRSVLYFFQRYFLRLGFLDGKEGFVWHFLHGFWFFVLIDAKIDEARLYIRENGTEAFKTQLRERHGVHV